MTNSAKLIELKKIANPTKDELKVISILEKKIAKELEKIANDASKNASNASLLDQINALGISDKVRENVNKSIFKAKHCNSASRGKCRKQFINAIGLFLLNLAHGKKDLADKNLISAKEIAKEYYSAEDSFKNASDYYTNGRGGSDIDTIKLFIGQLNK